MIARVQALTGLEFDAQAVKSNTKPNVGGAVEKFHGGDLAIRSLFPALPGDLVPVAIHHGYFGYFSDFVRRKSPGKLRRLEF